MASLTLDGEAWMNAQRKGMHHCDLPMDARRSAHGGTV